MKNPDPSELWRNLKESYSIMSESELQAVANDAYDLTDIAKEALQSEIAARGLSIQLKDNHSAGPDRPEMTVIKRAWDISEAREMQEFLLSAGVPSYLGPDNLEDVNDFHGSFERGVDLKISSADEQLAYRALARFKPSQNQDEQKTELIEDDDDAEYGFRCPKCHSAEIIFEGRDPSPPKDDGFYSKYNWTCEDCGHQWKDDGITEKVG